MTALAFQPTFDAWLDRQLANPIDDSVVAFNFNLAEPWSIEVIGSVSYDEEDSDWACDEAFRSGEMPLLLPEAEFGPSWQGVHTRSKALVSAYLARSSRGSEILRRAVAVAVGFVDGDLHRVWPE